ncbi:hypothetical protein [Enterobacter cloacae]|uniref:hypothetical protein n=1 Tax=Enterobacter cloacae TaxID=550 RepID=UPI000BA0F07C|nr:hypothetical protein [Enterobacter cloacae]OZU93188.1 hypothetical protein CIW67_10465 [Enterobacter cloacae]PAN85713.1 hypothetical protein CIW66_11520 [Enterobacter cloacae]PAN97847.1 hypothetical protein CIW63_10220 [Enterobacter cloacae]HAS1027638.1 hypothetical protein [Enterobacter cloacae]HAS1034792.1 hypothetical protein [Enterobacter cloacae]
MDILNNREIAIVLWLVAISIYIFSSSKMATVRNAFKNVLTAFFVKQIISVLSLMVAYMVIVIYWLYTLELWNFEQLKNTIFWCVSVGSMSLFKLEKIKRDKSFFKNSVLDNLKLLAILQFILGVYTFSLWIEIILVPILVLFGAMLAMSKKDREHKLVRTMLEYSLISFGVVLIVYTLYMLITDFGEFGQAKTAYDFFTPPMLTLLYLPFIFFMLVYSTYEQVFVCLRFAIKSRRHRYAAKLFAFILFNFQYKLLERWSTQVVKTNIKSYSDLIETFKYIFKVKHSEMHPHEVPKEQGWSPYKAKEFLINEGLITGFYNRVSEEAWFASSSMEEFSDGIIPDNIAYYIEGSEEVAKVLKLKVNVNDSSRTSQACEKLAVVAEVLSMSSLNQPLSEEMKNAISGCNSYFEKVEDKTITLIVEHWPNHKFKGFDLKLLIASI